MVDQALVTSGFDVEVLLSQRYLRYTLLAQIEAGRLPLEVPVVDEAAGVDVAITIHPPTDYERQYVPDPGAPLPSPVDGAFDTFLVTGRDDGVNLVVALVIDAVDHVSGQEVTEQPLDLELAVALVSDTDDRGFQIDHRLSIELVSLAGLFVDLARAAGADVDAMTAQVKAVLDRTVPFGVASGQAVQRAETVIHPRDGATPTAFGVYIALALKDGPEPDAFVADRGDVADAQNFLTDGADLAFATSPGLFDLLGPDVRHRMAEEDDDGGFVYPLRETPGDAESAVLGDLESITVGPQRDPLTGATTGKLLVHIDGNYDIDVLPDPDLDVFLTFDPQVPGGLLEWGTDARIDVGILGSVVGTLLVVGGLFLGPGVGVAIFVLLVAADLVTDALATAIAAERIEEGADASFLTALPHRVSVMERRWDPLYTTRHQVVTLIDGGVVINEKGIAFDGRATLGREAVATANTAIRDEDRDDDGHITALRYRVSNLADLADDLAEVAPGTDRRPFLPADDARPTLVGLTLDQIEARIEEGGRLVHPIACVPKRIELVEHRIESLLLICRREIADERNRLIRDLRRAVEAEIRTDLTEVVAEETERLRTELGRDPTDDEVAEAVDARVAALVDTAERLYERGGLDADLEAAIAAILSFDLAPHELADLQRKGVLVVEGKEIVRMASGTVYYRDRPDFNAADNLLSLPRYTAPYVPS